MSSPKAKRLGVYLRQQRHAQSLSLRQLAEKAGLAHMVVADFERGFYITPHPMKLAAIADALGLPVSDLFIRAGYSKPKDLPSPLVYFRAKYHDLPARELTTLTREVETMLARHGIRATAGPAPGEDEAPEPPTTRNLKRAKSKAKGGKT